jgi:hypothetical protein
MEQDTIRARRIELVDETGTPRAILEADSQGLSGLMVRQFGQFGGAETGIATIGVDANGIPLLLLQGQGEDRVFASATPNGAVVKVVDENGEEATLSV